MTRLLSRRQFTLFLTLLLIMTATIVALPARAAGPEGPASWTLDIGQNLDGCCYMSVNWLDNNIALQGKTYQQCTAIVDIVELTRDNTSSMLHFSLPQLR